MAHQLSIRSAARFTYVARTAAAAMAFVLFAAACGSDGEPAPAGSDDTAAPSCPTDGEEWEVAKLYIEHNATDEDTGVHGVFGGEAWRELCLFDPDGNRIWLADPQAQLGELAVSDFFFESREPPGDEYSVADLLADFPEGEYVVSGTDFEGTPRVGAARFTHAIPKPPVITAPTLAEDPETVLVPTPIDGLDIEWDAVNETVEGEQVDIAGYEVIVTMEEFEDPDGNSRPVYDVHVGPGARSLSVPPEWLEPDTIYEVEVLVLEESGNQTIAVGFFRTE